jgi:hypothetical protein
MSYTIVAPVSKKSAYQRPYKSRRQRREADRRKYNESKDHKFLVRIAVAIGLVVLAAIGFAMKGFLDRDSAAPIEAIR